MEITSNVEETLLANGRLTQDQVDQIKQMFILMDTDKSGTVTYDEVAKLMSKLAKSNYLSSLFNPD